MRLWLLTIDFDALFYYNERMFRTYDKDGDISYSIGAFPTVELIKKRKEDLVAVALASKLKMTDELAEILADVKDITTVDDRAIARVAKKGNVFMVGAFRKRYTVFGETAHVALVRPSDDGNLGTIMRTVLGFGLRDLAVIDRRSADVYDPKTVRASMGAVFSMNVSLYDSWEDYAAAHKEPKYLFMLRPCSRPITSVEKPDDGAYALVFGNEATGLPDEYAAYGTPVIIKHTDMIDSLNLPQAVAIGAYEFTKKNFTEKA